jgi:DNA-3-methyladenine glycosylase II
MPRLSPKTLLEAVDRLCDSEPRFRPVVEKHGAPSLRAMTQGVESLLLIVTEQFLSLQAAAAIWRRLEARLSPFDAATILRCPAEELVALGLSRAKARSFHGIAAAMAAGAFDCRSLTALDDEAAKARLLALPGVGPWTADIYLLAAELRPDVWPWGDLALQKSLQNLLGLETRPQGKTMSAMGERFAPFRAVAARLLWSHYRDIKGLKQA